MTWQGRDDLNQTPDALDTLLVNDVSDTTDNAAGSVREVLFRYLTDYTPRVAPLTTDTLQLADRYVAYTNSGTVTVTLPSDSVAIPLGRMVLLEMRGIGRVDLTAGAGATVNSNRGKTINKQHTIGIAKKSAANTWTVNVQALTSILTAVSGNETVGAADNESYRVYDSASPITVTMDSLFPSNGEWSGRRAGAGLVTISGGGFTYNGSSSVTAYGAFAVKREGSGTDLQVLGQISGGVDFFREPVSGFAQQLYRRTTGGVTLNAASFAAGSTIVHTGGAATYTLGSRLTSAQTGQSETLVLRKRGGGALTLQASGVTLVGGTSVADNTSVTLEWEHDGSTERVWVDGTA